MARKGENIYKRKDGRWIYCYNENGKAHYRSIYAKSYTEVKELLSACKLDITYNQHNSARKTPKYFCEE